MSLQARPLVRTWSGHPVRPRPLVGHRGTDQPLIGRQGDTPSQTNWKRFNFVVRRDGQEVSDIAAGHPQGPNDDFHDSCRGQSGRSTPLDSYSDIGHLSLRLCGDSLILTNMHQPLLACLSASWTIGRYYSDILIHMGSPVFRTYIHLVCCLPLRHFPGTGASNSLSSCPPPLLWTCLTYKSVIFFLALTHMFAVLSLLSIRLSISSVCMAASLCSACFALFCLKQSVISDYFTDKLNL